MKTKKYRIYVIEIKCSFTFMPVKPLTSLDLTICQALADFFEQQDLGADGGANDTWVKLRFGSFYIPFPNSAARKKAVMYHDIHHILTGYPTTWRGEAEIGAWEVASGCGDYRAAWIFDLGIFAAGIFIFPVAVFRAFIRGRRALNFYHHTHAYEQILQMNIAEVQTTLQLNNADKPALVLEIMTFIAWWLLAVVLSLAIYVAPVFIVIWLIVHRH
jgi:hypothetical protein